MSSALVVLFLLTFIAPIAVNVLDKIVMSSSKWIGIIPFIFLFLFFFLVPIVGFLGGIIAVLDILGTADILGETTIDVLCLSFSAISILLWVLALKRKGKATETIDNKLGEIRNQEAIRNEIRKQEEGERKAIERLFSQEVLTKEDLWELGQNFKKLSVGEEEKWRRELSLKIARGEIKEEL